MKHLPPSVVRQQAEIMQGSRPKCDGHFARPPARGAVSPGSGFFGGGGGEPCQWSVERIATAATSNSTRSATLTVPAGPPRYGLMPKSLCFTEKRPVA